MKFSAFFNFCNRWINQIEWRSLGKTACSTWCKKTMSSFFSMKNIFGARSIVWVTGNVEQGIEIHCEIRLFPSNLHHSIYDFLHSLIILRILNTMHTLKPPQLEDFFKLVIKTIPQKFHFFYVHVLSKPVPKQCTHVLGQKWK